MNFRRFLGLYWLRCVDCHKIRVRLTLSDALSTAYEHDDVCPVQIANRLWHSCACGCPAAPAGECNCPSLCDCDPCPYCDRTMTPWSHDATTPFDTI